MPDGSYLTLGGIRFFLSGADLHGGELEFWCIWLAVSVAVQCFHEPLLLKLHSFIDGNITTSQQKVPSFLVFAQKRASPGPADDLGIGAMPY